MGDLEDSIESVLDLQQRHQYDAAIRGDVAQALFVLN